MLDLAARVSTGSPWPDATACPVGDVLLLFADDGLAHTIVPRLAAAGADRERVHALLEIPVRDEDGDLHQVPPSLPRDITTISEIVTDLGVRLVVVDVLMAYLSGRVDFHRDQDVRGVLHELATMADRTGATVVLIRHMTSPAGTPSTAAAARSASSAPPGPPTWSPATPRTRTAACSRSPSPTWHLKAPLLRTG